MRKILDHLKADWYKYLIEIFVLIIGIYGAFMLDNWNESRKDRIEEIEILKNIHKDLNASIEEFQFLNSLRVQLIQATSKIFEISTHPQNFIPEELDTLLARTLIRPTYNGRMGTLELLFSTGKINLIRNEELKSVLINWPGYIDDLKEEEVYANEYFTTTYSPHLAKYAVVPELHNTISGYSLFTERTKGTVFEINHEVMKRNYDLLLADKKYLNDLALRARSIEIALTETNSMIERANKLQELIASELEK